MDFQTKSSDTPETPMSRWSFKKGRKFFLGVRPFSSVFHMVVVLRRSEAMFGLFQRFEMVIKIHP